MAHVSNMAKNINVPHFPNSTVKSSASTSCSLFMGSKKLSNSSKHSWDLNKNSIVTAKKKNRSVLQVMASVATTEKPSTVPEIVLQPIKEISGTVKLPGSKSLSNRILLLAALSEGTTVVDNLLSSDDIHYMLGALRTLGLNVEEDKAKQQAVLEGCGGLFPVAKESEDEIQLFLGNAGTAMRPLTAAVVAAGGDGRYVLDGVPRMRERPIGDLVTGLKQLGADVDCFMGGHKLPSCSCCWKGRPTWGK